MHMKSQNNTFNSLFTFALLALLSLGSGCASMIPNTTVDDNAANREVLEYMESYRHAVESKDIGQILAFADPQYLDDNGTPNGDDDIDYESLKVNLAKWSERITDIRFEVRYIRVHHEQRRVLVDMRYTTSFKVKSEGGKDRWSRRISDHRAVLSRQAEGEGFSFLSGM